MTTAPASDRNWFPAAVKRFVECVEAGAILKTTEFAGAVSVTDSNLLRNAGSCQYDSGAISHDGRQIILLFHCNNHLMEQGIGAFLEWEGDVITSVRLVCSEIQPGKPH